MKLQKGFTLLEMLVSTAILMAVVGAAVTALVQAQNATQGVALMANAQQSVRAGMNFMVRDLDQAGAGLSGSGIPIPAVAGASSLKRPGTSNTPTNIATLATFPTTWTVLPLVSPGSTLGQLATTLNPATGAVLTGAPMDIITVIYADMYQDPITANYLNSNQVVQGAAPGPACAGAFAANGSSVTIAKPCFNFPTTGPSQFTVGNLIMWTNANGSALEEITAVNNAAQTLTFSAGDPANLNTGGTVGTVIGMQNQTNGAPNGTLPTPTIERVWMVTYYVDAQTNPRLPQLMRQVNYPSAANPPQAMADAIEDLSFTYDIINPTAPAAAYAPNGAGDAATPILPDLPSQIRAVNVFLAGRSESVYAPTKQFFRNNLTTQVCLRSLAFQAPFSTTAGVPPVP